MGEVGVRNSLSTPPCAQCVRFQGSHMGYGRLGWLALQRRLEPSAAWRLAIPRERKILREAYFCCSALIGSEDCDEGTGAIGASFRFQCHPHKGGTYVRSTTFCPTLYSGLTTATRPQNPNRPGRLPNRVMHRLISTLAVG